MDRELGLFEKLKHAFLGSHNYCSECGQKIKDGDLTVRTSSAIYRTGFFNGLFNGKYKDYHLTCTKIFIPAFNNNEGNINHEDILDLAEDSLTPVLTHRNLE